MKQAEKKQAKLTNYNSSVGEAYHVSKNGVLTVDVNDEHFRAEFIRQLKLLKTKRAAKARQIQQRRRDQVSVKI